ncbi:M13 family metallopeptidase [Parerythrobacter lacustris]|uniref:M13 family metallopeptidase n=1 Tax=Parerythrobacter lacustris TaxID=2969984 RepID=A0ABT1XNI0_9SPHN|nr:M13 family metallopeptidase [Parerythrobacter lacustris]MCR2832486.1 M13 family metallopeptidase [Parerythrobacter lacustris]
MIRTLLALGVSATALALATPAFAEEAEAKPEEAVAAPTMSFGTWGFDPEYLSEDIDPGDDFFAYANQKWIDANPLPADRARFGAFDLLREKSTFDVKAVVDELTAKPAVDLTGNERRIVDAYNAFLDTDAIEAAGLAPPQPYLEAIAGADTLGELVTLWATPGYPSPVGGFVSVDAKEPTRYSVYVGSGGLGMPDREYYFDESEKGLTIRKAYMDYLTFLMGEAGYSDAAATAKQVYDFEDSIARKVTWDRAVRRNRDLTYTALTPEELGGLSESFPIAAFLATSGFGTTDRFIVGDMPPSAERIAELGLSEEVVAKIGGGTPAMLELLAATPLEVLKAWSIKSFLSSNASVLPARFDQANFAFFGTTLNGVPQQRDRWKRAIDATEGMLGELLGASYVERNFPPESKVAMDELVANLRVALAESLREIDWMSEETKVEAMAKLDSFDPKIGYRDNLETYEGLAIVGGNPLANSMSAAKWQAADNLAKLGQPIDRTEWGMLPQTVNAYYNSTKNEIVFPAGILQQPFFGKDADIAVNYGAIGGVIGHEMGHGFDDQGSKSDASGALRNWWTDADRKAFDEKGNALAAQYGTFCPLDEGTTCVNGRLSLGENIGDLGGLSMAYRAYKLATAGKEVPVIDGLTGDQRFFLAWAQVWRGQYREDALRSQIRQGPHSPTQYRTNGIVRNLDEWYEAFGVTPDDDLYLPPEQRIRIW